MVTSWAVNRGTAARTHGACGLVTCAAAGCLAGILVASAACVDTGIFRCATAAFSAFVENGFVIARRRLRHQPRLALIQRLGKEGRIAGLAIDRGCGQETNPDQEAQTKGYQGQSFKHCSTSFLPLK